MLEQNRPELSERAFKYAQPDWHVLLLLHNIAPHELDYADILSLSLCMYPGGGVLPYITYTGMSRPKGS